MADCETDYTAFLAKHNIPDKVTRLVLLKDKPLLEKETKYIFWLIFVNGV